MAKKTYQLAKPKAGAWKAEGNFQVRTAYTRISDTGDAKKDFASFKAYKAADGDKTSLTDVQKLVGGEKRMIRFALAGYTNKLQQNLRLGDKQKAAIAKKASDAAGVEVSSEELFAALAEIAARKAKKS